MAFQKDVLALDNLPDQKYFHFTYHYCVWGDYSIFSSTRNHQAVVISEPESESSDAFLLILKDNEIYICMTCADDILVTRNLFGKKSVI